MSGFGYDVLGFGSGAGVAGPEVDENFNRVSFLSHFDGANNGDNNAFDDGSASNHTITANGNVTQGSFGPFARPEGYWGVEFDGNDYLSLPASADYEFGTGDLTVEYWAFPTASGAVQNILDNRAEATGWKLGRNASKQFQVYNEATTSYLFEGGTFPEGEWSHFCWTRASGVNKFFINGVQSGSNVSDSSNFDSNSLRIGIRFDAGSQPFTGSIASVRVIKGTAVEPSGLPTSPPTAVTNTKLLTCQSNRIVDNSASAHTVTQSGNPSVSAFGPFLTDAAYDPAVNGASLYAPTYTDYLRIPNSAEFELDANFSVEFWVNLDTDFNATSGDTSVMFWANNNSQTQIAQNNDGFYFYRGELVIGNTDVLAKAKNWNHVALCRSGSVISLYCNGVRIGTASYTSTVDFSDAYVMTYVPNADQYGANGYMSDLRILKGSSAYDASQTTLTVPTAPLTAITNTKLLLNMANGQAIDSAAQNNLTLYGGAKLSTGQAKFGDTSMLMSSNGDYAASSESLKLGSGNFTVELFLRLTGSPSTGAYAVVFDNRPIQTVGAYLEIGLNDSRQLLIKQNNSAIIAASSATLLAIGQWYHIAYVRNGTTGTLYVNGTSVGSATDSLAYITGTLMWGKHAYSTDVLPGYFDEARVSKTARYTGNFTAPDEPFPDQGQV